MIVCLGVAIAVLGVFGAVGVGGVVGAGARSVFKIRFSAVKCFFIALLSRFGPCLWTQLGFIWNFRGSCSSVSLCFACVASRPQDARDSPKMFLQLKNLVSKRRC